MKKEFALWSKNNSWKNSINKSIQFLKIQQNKKYNISPAGGCQLTALITAHWQIPSSIDILAAAMVSLKYMHLLLHIHSKSSSSKIPGGLFFWGEIQKMEIIEKITTLIAAVGLGLNWHWSYPSSIFRSKYPSPSTILVAEVDLGCAIDSILIILVFCYCI